MKNDVTRSVMRQVLQFEEKRTKGWLLIFSALVLLIASCIALGLVRTYFILAEQHTWDVLELFGQDREIIAEFWQDTLIIFWTEIPKVTLFFSIGLLLVLILVWIITRRQRQIVRRRLTEFAKRRKNT